MNHWADIPESDSRLAGDAPSPLPRCSAADREAQHRRLSRGFTLTELLVVVGVIVLIVTLAVPAFNVISGNRSIDAAQNQLAAIIGRARQDAIGLEDFRGVIMFQDPNTGRSCAAEVYFPTAGIATLDVTPSHDELLLPPGISFRMVETTGGVTPMNVIMFDSRGRFVSRPWTILNVPPTTKLTTTSPPGTALGLRVIPLPNPSFPAGMPVATLQGSSAFGFILFPDEIAYRDQYLQNSNTTYLTDNGITFLVNRYNGTLLRSE